MSAPVYPVATGPAVQLADITPHQSRNQPQHGFHLVGKLLLISCPAERRRLSRPERTCRGLLTLNRRPVDTATCHRDSSSVVVDAEDLASCARRPRGDDTRVENRESMHVYLLY